ncbi:MAG TPA: asparagine synthase-related protein [Niabella sp.]|nr:asparagine synthase-related protein [Niabella sp.]HOZ98057.1 asparagine synthase-related protein [Niabella sp.]HQW14798.1 asparagine synthase-related protein [Niabella sp.]HQX18577.1 asparagine synthase-related protein [Niabella sp.]HQX40797.1 asparagine synthase-related protein [Niabella sp.]
MSLIFGFWHDTTPLILEETLQQMFAATKPLPHDGKDFGLLENMGFGLMRTLNTSESANEKIILSRGLAPILFAPQGRIDNREQLSHHLKMHNEPQVPDGDFMLASYQKWGKDCVNYLKGDWSFALYDQNEKELFIAKAPMGLNTIYYMQQQNGFYFSSSIKSLINLDGYNKQLNELYFIRWLCLWDDTLAIHDTYFKNIYCLPAGHTLTIKNKKIKLHSYWQPQSNTLIHYKNKQDYADEMLELFTQSTKARLRSIKPVASMLSGGLDSSSASYMAAELLKSSHTKLATYSHIPYFTKSLHQHSEGQDRVLDETPFILATAQASGNIQPTFLNSKDYSVLKGMTDAINILDAPSHGAANLYWMLDLYSTVADQGFGTLLSAEGGNGSISFAGLDYLLPLKFSPMIRHPYKFFRNQVAKPLGYTFFMDYINKKRGATNNLEKYISSIFLHPSIQEQYEIVNDIQVNKKDFVTKIKDINEIKSLFVTNFYARSNTSTAFGHYYGIELRDPTIDVDLMNYFFRIPNEVFFDDDYNNRMLVKRMMKGRLPDSVLFEKRKGLQSADILYRIKAQWAELTMAIESIKCSSVVNHYLDTKRMSETWYQYQKQDYVETFKLQTILKALQFGLFLQMHFD